jgi:hypothetical protein
MRFARALVIAALFGASTRAEADEAPASIAFPYSPYETAAISAAERTLGATVDPVPEGKLIERIDVVRLDPIEPRDPAPEALDLVHATTREDIVRHEVLAKVGTPYRAAIVDESARNLRQLPQLSLVVCVAFRGRAKGSVRLVVITKDVWSLYPDFDIGVTSGGLEYLLLEPKETNLAGTHQTILARTIVQPESMSLGGAFAAPRLGGRWLAFVADANVIVNRTSGALEGSFGTFSIERPLYSAQTAWAWSVASTWKDEVFRRYTNARVATFGDRLPWEYRARRIDEQASVTRSFGYAAKNDLTLGAQITQDAYRVPDPSIDPAAAADFTRAEVPVGEARVGPFAQWRTYTTDFVRIVDLDTLALQEDYRLGHDVVARVYPIVHALGATRDLVGVRAAALYTVRLGDGLARAWIDTTTEGDTNRVTDAQVSGDVRIVSPRTGLGRVVFDVTAQNRWKNSLNRTVLLGGEERLRGFPTRYFVGKDLFAMSLELRSRPIEVASIQLGAAAFYDVAQAFDGFDHLHPGHSVGVGVRVVLPQIERAVIRADLGFPIGAGDLPGVAPAAFFVTFGQAFKMAGVPAPFGP